MTRRAALTRCEQGFSLAIALDRQLGYKNFGIVLGSLLAGGGTLYWSLLGNGALGGVVLIVFGGLVVGLANVLGVVVTASGQVLLATLDTAINTSRLFVRGGETRSPILDMTP